MLPDRINGTGIPEGEAEPKLHLLDELNFRGEREKAGKEEKGPRVVYGFATWVHEA